MGVRILKKPVRMYDSADNTELHKVYTIKDITL